MKIFENESTKKLKNYKLYILVFSFILTRFINLTILPVFNDEAIYIDWGQKMLSSGNLFFSLFDGKQPLLMWVFGFFANLFPDPLFGGRFVSILFSALTIPALYLLAKKYYSEKTAFISCLIYMLSPISVFYDRQALMEAAIVCLGIWSFFFLTKFIEKKDYQNALILGIFWGLGLFIKTSFIVYIISSILILSYLIKFKNEKNFSKIFISIPVTFLILLPLILQPDFFNGMKENTRFYLGFMEIFSFPFKIWINNLISYFDISFFHVTGLLILPLFPALVKYTGKGKSKNLIIWYISGIAIYILTTKSPNSRYIYPFLTFAIPMSISYLLNFRKIIFLIFLLPTIIWFLILDSLLIFSPVSYFEFLGKYSGYSYSESYLGSFTSGYGVKEAINFVINELNGKSAIVGTRLDAGNPENAVFMYLSKYKNIKAVYLDAKMLDPEWKENYLVSNLPIYFITRNGQRAGLDAFLIERKSFPKPDAISSVVVYQLRTKKE